MIVESIETFLIDQVAMVRVRTDDGIDGYGQTAPFAPEQTIDTLHALVAPFFVGQDPWDLEVLIDRCLREQYKFPSTFIYRALCGIDTAIWDVLGKATGQPVYKLLGGKHRDKIPVYASSMSRSISPAAEAERIQELRETNGFRAAKVRLGNNMGRDRDTSPGRTEALIPHMRRALGDDFELCADANGGFSAAHAIKIGRILEENNYYHFEEPCPFPLYEETARVADALDIPVAGGEQDNSLEQFQRMINRRVVDIVQPDIGYLGGMSRARKVAGMADIAGIPCTPHCSNTSMLQIFVMHLVASMPACTHYQEWGIESGWKMDGMYSPMPKVIDGYLVVGDDPGWGIQLNKSILEHGALRMTHVKDGAIAGGMR